MYSEAQKKAQLKYQKEKQVQLNYRITPEQKERFEAAAQKSGKSLRAFILEAIELNILLQDNLDEIGEFYKKKLLEFIDD